MLHPLARHPRILLASAALAGAVLLVGAHRPAQAQAQAVFTGDLDGPTAGTASPATGAAELVLSLDQTEVTYEITVDDLQGEELAARFHVGDPDAPGPPIHDLPLGTPKIGTWEPTESQFRELLAGNVWVVISTDRYPGGEVAGPVETQSAAVDRETWRAVKDLFR
jgi:hypothetical protein